LIRLRKSRRRGARLHRIGIPRKCEVLLKSQLITSYRSGGQLWRKFTLVTSTSGSRRRAEGARIAIIRASGAGKSSLADLLVRFRDPTSGEICLRGKPLPHLASDVIRSRIAIVGQSPHLFLINRRRQSAPGASAGDARRPVVRVGHSGASRKRSALCRTGWIRISASLERGCREDRPGAWP
jgi:hypothetical protein